ncbi:MAG: hypothetical protein EXR72_21850 [Myxococcales bacterium]|nr:hypothetical protein [Myxococcales bacterium]
MGCYRASMGQRRAVALLLSAVAGCTPLVPFHLAETSQVLSAGEVSVSGAAGAESFVQSKPDFLGGIGLRVRGGVGHRQELGGEVF